MLLPDSSSTPIPELTVQVARAAFPKGNTFISMRDTLGTVFCNQDFAQLFSERGQPGLAPWRLALITIMQFVEGLSDRQAAEAVRSRIDWKYALSLELSDPGFDFSVLCEFRSRLISGAAETLLLDKFLERFKELGLLKAGGRQRTDSTHVLAAVREIGRLECVTETLRHALNAVAEVAPVWLRALAPSEWYERYGKRVEESRLPRNPDEREAYAATVGKDGLLLLDTIWGGMAPQELRQLPAVQTLRLLWLQQFYAPAPEMQWRKQEDRPPCIQQIRTPYDLEARYATKRTTHWTGYKVHLSETCDDDAPRFITHVVTAIASQADQQATSSIHQALAQKDLTPKQHFVDTGYMSLDLIIEAQQKHSIELLGPMHSGGQWQGIDKQGYNLASFAIDWQKRRVICPQGWASYQWKTGHNRNGQLIHKVQFAKHICKRCPVRSLCTRSRSDGRSLSFRHQPEWEQLQEARKRRSGKQFEAEYAVRSGVEGTISQAVRAFDVRHNRYIGFAKTQLQHVLSAAAMNVVRLGAWLRGDPLAQTRCSWFTKLAATGAPNEHQSNVA
jgi:transposase